MLGLSEKQAQEVAQSTVGVLASIKEAGKGAKERSMDIGNTAISRLGSAAGGCSFLRRSHWGVAGRWCSW
jgi:hypothetical protein